MRAGVMAAGAFLAVVAGAGTVGVMSASGAKGPVTTPTGPALATVAPEVADKMNNGKGRSDLAPGIMMKKARPWNDPNAVGKGRGNGCMKGYGDPGQCLPLVSPAQQRMPEMDHPWTCAEVRVLFPDGVEVRGGPTGKKDTLGLDTDSDGVACGPRDRG